MTFNIKISFSILSITLAIICYNDASLASSCVSDDCSALGYTKTESKCEGDIVRCPFDTTKVFCKETEKCTITTCDTTEYPLLISPAENLAVASYESCTATAEDCTTTTQYKITACADGYVHLSYGRCVAELQKLSSCEDGYTSIICNGYTNCCPSSLGYTNCSDIENGTFKCLMLSSDVVQ